MHPQEIYWRRSDNNSVMYGKFVGGEIGYEFTCLFGEHITGPYYKPLWEQLDHWEYTVVCAECLMEVPFQNDYLCQDCRS